MIYEIKSKLVPFEPNKIIEVELPSLCKIIELKEKFEFQLYLEIVYLERYGSIQSPLAKHRIVLMTPGTKIEYTKNYEPVFSRRGKVNILDTEYYVFSVS